MKVVEMVRSKDMTADFSQNLDSIKTYIVIPCLKLGKLFV
jgi:hypothetical protein